MCAAGSLLKTVLAEYAGALAPRQKDLLAKADRRIDEAVETVRRMMAAAASAFSATITCTQSRRLSRLYPKRRGSDSDSGASHSN